MKVDSKFFVGVTIICIILEICFGCMIYFGAVELKIVGLIMFTVMLPVTVAYAKIGWKRNV